MRSKTWLEMSEPDREEARANFRELVAGMMQIQGELSPADQRIVTALDACLMEDRIELGGSIAALMNIEEFGHSDYALGMLLEFCERIDPVQLDPSRN